MTLDEAAKLEIGHDVRLRNSMGHVGDYRTQSGQYSVVETGACDMQLGDIVVWKRGSVGLSGQIVGERTLEGAEPQWSHLWEIETSYGHYYEFECNLRTLPRLMP